MTEAVSAHLGTEWEDGDKMAASFSFQKIITGNSDLDRVQANIANAFNLIVGQFLGGQFLTGVSVSSSGTVISHKLGRQPLLWVICDQDTNTTVKRTAWNSNTITLESAANCTISLWVN